MAENDGTKEPIQFPINGAPKLREKPRRNRALTDFCRHTATLLIDQETQLVECSKCKTVMSAFNALMLITREWASMHYDTTEWKKVRADHNAINKHAEVRRHIRQLQWIDRPDDEDPEAQQEWDRVTEAIGEPPYAMFRRKSRGKTIQYLLVDGRGGYTDSEYAIKYAAVKKMKLANSGEQSNG